MSENQESKNLMEKLPQVDRKLEAINSPLASQASINRKAVAAPDSHYEQNPENTIPGPLEDADNEEASRSGAQSENPLPRRAAITASEAESFLHMVDKINRDAKIMERVERLERQNRKITILGSLVMICMVLVLTIFTVLMFESNLLSKGVGRQASQESEFLKKPPVQENAANLDKSKPIEPVAKVTEPPTEPMKVVSDAKPTKVMPPATYVGSITSNKYHYPQCKWAAEISPKKLRTFSSVKEARAEGYIPCPTCQPPKSDEEKLSP
jgi:hypothetical protein